MKRPLSQSLLSQAASCTSVPPNPAARNRISPVLDRFASEANILPCDLAVAQVYGALKNRLRLLGRRIPENDLWIAAIALQHRLILATRDEHFSHIEDLMVAAW